MKPVIRLTIFLAVFLFASALAAGNALFSRANEAYSRGEYEQAVSLYLEVIQEEGASASLLYNLANSYAAWGKTGLAILNYERALRLAPWDADVQANLAQVRKDSGLYGPDVPAWQRIVDLLGPDRWLMVAVAALFAAGLPLLLGLKLKRPGTRMLLLPIIFSLGILGLALAAAWTGYQGWHDCVVIRPAARLLLSPFAESEATGPIREGRIVRPLRNHKGYVLVQDRLGRRGWLPDQALGCIDRM